MRKLLWPGLTILVALALVAGALSSGALASQLVPQVKVNPNSLAKYMNPLPFFGPGGVLPRVDGTANYIVTYNEFQQMGDLSLAPLYTGTFPTAVGPFAAANVTGTLVWGYNTGGQPVASWPAVTVEAQVGTPVRVRYRNTLPVESTLQQYITVDQTLHWANPKNLAMNDPLRMFPYEGPPPVVAHLHGAEVASAFDGGPDAWFLPAAVVGYSTHGPGYRSITPANPANVNQAIYRYVNNQEPATLWYHEHSLGATRTNVFSGLAGFYFLRGFGDDGVPGMGKLPASSGGTAREIEIAIQDRSFDTQGQLFFPDVGINPEHPFWVPEFAAPKDVITVNGKVWPTLTVDPVRYRFRFLEGSNARFYNLSFKAVKGPAAAPTFWVIGTDGGFLDNPVNTPELLFAPGERYDTIVDFSAFAGRTFLIVNNAKAPYPGGSTANPSTVGQIMQIVVNPGPVADSSYNPATDGRIRDAAGDNKPTSLPLIVRLANPATGQIAAGVNPARVRQLTLNEILGPGGPLEILVNNSHWNGVRPTDGSPVAGGQAYLLSSESGNDTTNYLTELPQIGSTEVWEIVNLTADAHPIHMHLVQFQLLNRQAFTTQGSKGYVAAYNAAFPGGAFIPAYGPPSPLPPGQPGPGTYNTVQGTKTLTRADGSTTDPINIIGGNPNVDGFLKGAVILPRPYEAGWKDTFIMNPGEVTRVVVRWTPQNIAVGAENVGHNQFVGFNPTSIGNPPDGYVNGNGNAVGGGGGGPGYVFHCHIIDHEDNEMMRPYFPVNNPDNLGE
jgi:spore coat protein A